MPQVELWPMAGGVGGAGRASTWTPEEIAKLVEAHRSGMPRRAIALHLGRPKSTIDYRLATLGVREGPRPSSLAARFWKNVDVRGADECWPWTGYTDARGYGSISIWPTRTGSHRVAYALTHGEIPDEFIVRHDCDNPPCCNPSHLRLGTMVDNNRDKTERGRDAKGEGHGMARYTTEQVREVKRLLATTGLTHAEIAASAGVKVDTVDKISSGRQWKEVQL